MEEYIKWLEKRIEVCLEDRDLQREHWAFCQSLSKYKEIKKNLRIHSKPNVFQRISYWLRLNKDPRYDGKRANWMLHDEIGH